MFRLFSRNFSEVKAFNMKTKIILPILLSFASICSNFLHAQNMVDEKGFRQGAWKITAAMKKLGSPWMPDQIVEEGNYIDSKKEGVWVSYHQNGTKCGEVAYKAGRREGITKYFDNTGSIISSAEYVNGKRDGIMTTYYPDGKVWTEFTWKNGITEGPAKTYYPSGQLYEEGFWANGAFIRDYKIYNENGTRKR